MAFSQQPRYDRAFREVLAKRSGDPVRLNDNRLMMLWDYFVLEHRLRNGRTVVEQFVDAHPDLSESEREMFRRVPRPRVSPASDRLAAYADRR